MQLPSRFSLITPLGYEKKPWAFSHKQHKVISEPSGRSVRHNRRFYKNPLNYIQQTQSGYTRNFAASPHKQQNVIQELSGYPPKHNIRLYMNLLDVLT